MKQTMRVLLFIVAIILGQLSVEVKAQGFTVGSYNLRYANRGDSARGNGWGQRYPVMVNMIQFHGFDIFGTQEGLYPQLEDLVQHLPGYAYTGIGRDDGKHTQVNILRSSIIQISLSYLKKATSGYQPSPIGRTRDGMRYYQGSVHGGSSKKEEPVYFLFLQPPHGSCGCKGKIGKCKTDSPEDQRISV